MANVFDVAAYILQRHGKMTTMKLQKLVYYSQAWSLVWDEEPIFPERIRAWAGGPVVPELFAAHQGEFAIDACPSGNPDRLTPDEKETVDAVLKGYGAQTGAELSDRTHREAPWIDARRGLGDGDRGNVEITHGAMADYYGNL